MLAPYPHYNTRVLLGWPFYAETVTLLPAVIDFFHKYPVVFFLKILCTVRQAGNNALFAARREPSLHAMPETRYSLLFYHLTTAVLTRLLIGIA